jgi:alpha-amylase
MQDIFDRGYPMSHFQAFLQSDPYHAVPFVDSPDTDTSFGQQIANSKLLAYAIMCACEGVPQVYYRDWSTDEYCYGLGRYIDNLVWIHRNLAWGSSQYHFPNENVMVVNRTGWPGLLMAVNKDTWNTHVVSVPTSFGPNAHLHDYSGHHGDIWTNNNGWATFKVPSNAYSAGQSYVAFGPVGITGAALSEGLETTQEFEGADDLITPAVKSGDMVDCGRIWVAAGHPVKTSINSDLMTVGIVNAKGTQMAGEVPSDGWYTVRVHRGADGGGPMPFVATVKYLAPKSAKLTD